MSPKYRSRAIEVETIRLEYRTLIQTPKGAMSAEIGDYLETIRVNGKVHQRIVPAWLFEASQKNRRQRKTPLIFETAQSGSLIDVTSLDSKIPEHIPMPRVLTLDGKPCGEPHDGYPLTRE